MSSSWFLTGSCEKNSHREGNWRKRGVVFPSLEEEAMHAIIGRKLARSTVRRTTSCKKDDSRFFAISLWARTVKTVSLRKSFIRRFQIHVFRGLMTSNLIEGAFGKPETTHKYIANV